MEVKTCTCCGETKNISEFYKMSRSKDGHMPQCKICVSEKYKKYRNSVKDKENAKRREKYKEDKERKERYINRAKKYYEEHKDNKKEYDKIYRKKNKEKIARQKRD